MKKFIEELRWRGLIYDITDEEKLEKLLEEGLKVYNGFDPTADSLHVGNLVPLTLLRRFQLQNQKIYALVGGGTGQIGDPSGRKDERTLLDLDQVKYNVDKISAQITKILAKEDNPVVLVDNAEWGNKITMFEFLRDYGKYFNISYMLAKESVSSRLESGLSYTEFSYTILQALDWLHLYNKYGINMQTGGSDQWGNITSGLELIRKKTQENNCVGLTVPLITKSDGSKFGKSVGGAVWLDAEKTSPYEFYQFFLNTPDDDIIKLMKVFSFKSKEEIEAIEKEFLANPHQRLAQHELAKEMCILIHGEAEFEKALEASKALFSGNIKDLDIDMIKTLFDGVPTCEISEDQLNIIDFLVETNICKSKREAREFVGNGAILVNGEKVVDDAFIVDRHDAFNNEISIIRKGKKKYHKVIFN